MGKPRSRIGVDRLFYALLTKDDETGATYGTPKALLGVSSVGFNPNSSNESQFADDGVYDSYSQTGNIEVTINVADLLPEDYAVLVGANRDNTNGLVKDGGNDTPPEVALMYRTQKSNGAYRYYTIYKTKASKPEENAETKGDSVNFQTKEVTFAGMKRDFDGLYRQTIDSDDDKLPVGVTEAILNSSTTGWFSSPNYVPVAQGTPISDLVAATASGSSPVDGDVDLTFSAPTGAISVKAQVEDELTGSWVNVATAAEITATSTTARVKGLTAGNNYNFRLAVIGGSKAGVSNEDAAVAYDAV